MDQAARDAIDSLASEPVRGPVRVNYTHEDMADFMVANPWVTQNELAARYGYTPAWVSMVVNSDAFQALLARRREALVDPVVRLTVEEKFKAVVARSLDVLAEKMQGPACTVPDNVALRAAEMGAKILAAKAAQGNGRIEEPGERLSKLAERLVQLKRNTDQGVIDVEAQDIRGA